MASLSSDSSIRKLHNLLAGLMAAAEAICSTPQSIFSPSLSHLPSLPPPRPTTLDASLNMLALLHLDHQDIHSTMAKKTTELPRLEDADPTTRSRTIKFALYPPDLVRRGDRWVINPEFYKQARHSSGRNPSDPVPKRDYYPLLHHQRAFDKMEQRNARSIKTSPDLDLTWLGTDSDHPDRPDHHPPHSLITAIICAIRGSPDHRLTETELEIAIKRRFAYYANPKHAEGFSVTGGVLFSNFASPLEDLSEVLSSHPWLTLTHQHPAGDNPFHDTDWWTVRPNRSSWKSTDNFKHKFEFQRPDKTRSKQASRDSDDGWADGSTTSLSGDDAKTDGRKSTVITCGREAKWCYWSRHPTLRNANIHMPPHRICLLEGKSLKEVNEYLL
ncbi:hypothetical protein JB92DRAFT_3118506 [Gautieria morchelliformis]|nr:hypothetical protein JB92DRAFT_3118506 [Gautieria morchelliformis]